MTYYDSTSCTDYYIDHAEVYTGISASVIEGDCVGKNGYPSFYYERDNKNKKSWVSNMKKEKFGVE